MLLQNRTLFNFALGMDEFKKKRLPIKLSFAIKYNFDIALPAITAFESARNEIVEREKNPDKELLKLLDESVELAVKTISLEDLERAYLDDRYDALTLEELERLSFMISEES